MSSLDKDSGVRAIPTLRCPKCHQNTWYTSAGILIHLNPESRCS